MILRSIVDAPAKAVITFIKTLNDASTLCFGAAVACFLVGAIGWIVNWFVAGATTLHGFLVVAVFYFMLGVIKLFEKEAASSPGLDKNCDFKERASAPIQELQAKVKRLESAA